MTPTDLHAEINLRFADNITQGITPAVLRDFLHEQVDALSPLVLPCPRVWLKHKPAQTAVLGVYNFRNQLTGFVQQEVRNVVQLRFDQPLSAALLARNPEIWVFRYSSLKKKYAPAQALLSDAYALFDRVKTQLKDNQPLTPAQLTALEKSGSFLIRWVAGFEYYPYDAADSAGWAGRWQAGCEANQARMQARLEAGTFRKRRGGWHHPVHKTRHSTNFWSGASQAGASPHTAPFNGSEAYTSEFFDETMRYALGQFGQWDVNLVPAEWFTFGQRDDAPFVHRRSRRRSKRGAAAPRTGNTRFRFALAVPAKSGEASRGGYVFSELSEEVVLTANILHMANSVAFGGKELPTFETLFNYLVLPGTFKA